MSNTVSPPTAGSIYIIQAILELGPSLDPRFTKCHVHNKYITVPILKMNLVLVNLVTFVEAWISRYVRLVVSHNIWDHRAMNFPVN